MFCVITPLPPCEGLGEGLLVIARLAVLVDVESFVLDALVDTQAVQALDAVEEDNAAQGYPEVDDQDAEQLGSEESPSVAVEGSIADGEQSCHECAEDTANTMY